MATNDHRWKFSRTGGVDQVMLRNGADIVNLESLDPKLWVALSMPTRGIEFDARTLDLIDTDKDHRVRVPEILAAIKWMNSVLKDPDTLLKGGSSVALSALKDGPVLSGAKRILANLGKKDAKEISLDDVADTTAIFVETKFNGDGIVPVMSADEADHKLAIEQIIDTMGSVTDRSGKPGVDKALVDAFFAEAKQFVEWKTRTDAQKDILVLGEKTADAHAAMQAIAHKINDYFARVRLAAFDPRAANVMSGLESDLAVLAGKELSSSTAELAKLPLARVEANKPLPLQGAVNPAWAGPLSTFAESVAKPVLGSAQATLTETEWASIQSKLAPFGAWAGSKPGTKVEKLGLDRLRALLGNNTQEVLLELIRKDAALKDENDQIESVEKALRFQRDLFRLLNNFVNFSDFYGRKGAVFQVGTLYLDGRSCNLCVDVTDAGKHGALASLSGAYLAYCDCTRKNGEKMTIAAAFTDGDADNLMVGRNGLFYDRKGNDWDATITKVISNPISVREAFWTPYKKFARMVEEQFTKRAAAAEEESNKHLTTMAEKTVASTEKPKDGAAPAPAPASPLPVGGKKFDVGTIAAIGVAIGGIGAMVAGILSAFFGLGKWMPFGLLGVVLLISGPSMLLAYLKLRQRNLGPLLDANGWAINTRARINVPFGGALTDIAALPSGSERAMTDPYADKKSPWRIYTIVGIILALGLAWFFGSLDSFLPGPVKSTKVLGSSAPAKN